MAEIVVIGAGIGGLPAAYDLKKECRAEDNITVISNNPYFQFTPSNPWAAVGWRKREDITIDLEPVLKKQGITFLADPMVGFDPENSVITLQSGKEVKYD